MARHTGSILLMVLGGSLLVVGGLLSLTGVGAICGLPMILAASFVLMWGWHRARNAAMRDAMDKVRDSAERHSTGQPSGGSADS